MSDDLLAAAAAGDNDAWTSLAGALASDVWSHVSTISDFGKALDAGSVVFHRLADECERVGWDGISLWISDTAADAVSQAESATWRIATPPGQRDVVPGELLAAANAAFRLRAASRPIAGLVLDTADADSVAAYEARAVTVPWRTTGTVESLLLPTAVWRGVFAADDVTVDLTLITADGRRIVGLVDGLDDARVRLRGTDAWEPVGDGGRFRMGDVPEQPLSVEVAGADNAVVTQWRML